ncbi:unnamed protein product [Peniophora sp. CBMAI 1063]|nr:unnamed protein product [Peniophora sp. CBMAI 1063]
MPIYTLADQNAAQPISRMMSLPELLSAVVHHALDVYPPELVRKRKGAPESSLERVRRLGAAVIISHVCSAWRTRCIATPTVWARQIGLVPPATEEFLARSGEALVDIYWRSSTNPGEWPAGAVIAPMRLRHLFWECLMTTMGPSNQDILFLQRAFSGRLSNLVTLGLCRVDLDAIGSAFDGANPINLPHLVHLSLTDLFATARAVFNAPQLHTFAITLSKVTLTSIFVTLRSTALLERLTVNRCTVISGDEEEYLGNDGVELRHLRNMTVVFGYDDGLGENTLYIMLASIQATPQVYRVALDGVWTNRLLSVCLRATFEHDAPAILTIEERILFYSRVGDERTHLPPELDEEGIRASLAYPSLPWFARTLPALGMRAFLSNITVLAMMTICAAYLYHDTEHLRSVMSALPNVETYWVLNSSFGQHRDNDYDDQDAFSFFIGGLAFGLAANEDEHTPFPRLRTVGVCAVSGGDDSWLFKTLSQVLASRDAAGVPHLEGLSFPFMSRPPDDVEDQSVTHLTSLVQVYWSDSRDDVSAVVP